MKIIHCSDLHLDSAMDSRFTPEQARQRNGEICRTFGRMAEYAGTQNVRLILVAGDLFDTERVSASTVDYILNTVAGKPGIDFLYLRGNHDESRRAFAGRSLPQNLKMFTDSWQYYRYGNLTVAGTEIHDGLYSELSLNPDDTNIVMLHGQTGTQSGKDLVCVPLLREKHIDYLALGHIHSFRTGKLDASGIWCYSGCPEGRGFDECGEKGFVLLNAENHRITAEFVPFASRTLHEIPIDISEMETVPEMLQAAAEASRKISGKDLVRFVLTGACGPETRKDPEFLKQSMEGRFWYADVKDESRLRIPEEEWSREVSLKGAFIRQVMASDFSEEDKQKMIAAGLQALRGEAVTL